MSGKRFFGFGEFGAWVRSQIQTLTDHLNLKLGEVNTRMDGVDQTLLNKADQSALDSTNQAVATKANQNEVSDALDTKLDATAAAVDSAKLGGQLPTHYAIADNVFTKTESTNLFFAKTSADKAVVSSETVLVPNTALDYNLGTLIGDTHIEYDLLGAQIEVKIKDIDVDSLTYNCFINSEAAVVAGVDNEGLVKIVNLTESNLTAHVRIDVHRKIL